MVAGAATVGVVALAGGVGVVGVVGVVAGTVGAGAGAVGGGWVTVFGFVLGQIRTFIFRIPVGRSQVDIDASVSFSLFDTLPSIFTLVTVRCYPTLSWGRSFCGSCCCCCSCQVACTFVWIWSSWIGCCSGIRCLTNDIHETRGCCRTKHCWGRLFRGVTTWQSLLFVCCVFDFEFHFDSWHNAVSSQTN